MKKIIYALMVVPLILIAKPGTAHALVRSSVKKNKITAADILKTSQTYKISALMNLNDNAEPLGTFKITANGANVEIEVLMAAEKLAGKPPLRVSLNAGALNHQADLNMTKEDFFKQLPLDEVEKSTSTNIVVGKAECRNKKCKLLIDPLTGLGLAPLVTGSIELTISTVPKIFFASVRAGAKAPLLNYKLTRIDHP